VPGEGETLKGRHGRIEPKQAAGLGEIVQIIVRPGSHVQYQDGPAGDLCEISKVLECIGTEATAIAWSTRRLMDDVEEQEESSSPTLYGAASYLMPMAMIEAALREPQLTRQTRPDLLQVALKVLFG
jgi:hypothetical protein